MVRNQAAGAGSATSGRVLGSMENWIGAGDTPSAAAATNEVLATAGAAASTAAISSKVPGAVTDASTNGAGAITSAALEYALEGAWADGGYTDLIAVSGTVKAVVNGFTSIATRNVDIGRRDQAIITGAADVYVSSFGVDCCALAA